MSQVFISYSVDDQEFANKLYSALKVAGVDTFLASFSIEPGKTWKDEILENLNQSQWVFYVASKSSIKSDPVKHELGAALTGKKTIIPLLLKDVTFDDLPSWISHYQGIDLKTNPETLTTTISAIAKKINSDKSISLLILGALLIALVLASK